MQQSTEAKAMMSKVKDFVTETTQSVADQARRLPGEPVKAAREAAMQSAGRINALKDPVRAFARSGVKLTAISHGTAQSLIELQEKIVTAALSDAASRLERASRTVSVGDMVRSQADVLKATRERIVNDMKDAVTILKGAGGDVRKVATQTYARVTGKEESKPVARTKTARKAKRTVRKAGTRARAGRA
jgi:phasin family protein